MEPNENVQREQEAEGSVRATEQRRTEMIFKAVVPLPGENDTRRIMDQIEAHEDDVEPEGAGAKLARMSESRRGRQWLREHPQANWADIAAAGV